MAKRRVRLNDDNDPLSSTDKVLAGFEQVSQSTSQKADKPVSQTDDVSTSQQDSNTTSQQQAAQHFTPPSSDTNTLSESLIRSQQPDQITSQQFEMPTTQPNSNSTLKQADLLASQQVNPATLPSVEKVKLRKSTFQISEAVLHQLDQLHLTLQLELGKANAPYKEVIVESALVRLLESVNSDRAALIETLVSRQKSRDKS